MQHLVADSMGLASFSEFDAADSKLLCCVKQHIMTATAPFKVTDHQKPEYDFLFVNNTNLYPTLHHFKVSRYTCQIIAFDRVCLNLTPSFGVNP